ncbi:putative ribonuclease H-like domain-containing protein [Tanacetum coccineum]|uniref:Ribonuclease H-like domain-containing protein n=1 Tax=Tanacetum coccineum TaxID=301880 RepID=A0ABQ5CAN4_9ASTR
MKAVKEKEQLQKTVDSWKDSSKNLWKLVDSGMSSTSKVGLGYEIKSNDEVLSYEEEMNRTVFNYTEEDFIEKPLYSRFSKTDSFKGFPHPLTGDYTPKPQQEIDESLYVYGKKGSQKPEISVSDDTFSENSVTNNEKVVSEPKPTEVEPSCDHPLKNMEDRGIFDSGCSWHMTGNKDHLDDFEECKGGSVTFGGSKGYITGKGRIRHKVLFTKTECLVVSPDFKMPDENQILLKVPRQHNMYSFDMKTPALTKDYACLIAKATSDESKLWHRRFSWVFFLATKDETNGILQNFIRQIENQLNLRVKIIRSYNDTEFKNRDMLEFCENKGIKQEYSNARTPQQNEVAERMNMTLIEAAKTMLADSLLPTTFWAEAVSTACYIFNRHPNVTIPLLPDFGGVTVNDFVLPLNDVNLLIRGDFTGVKEKQQGSGSDTTKVTIMVPYAGDRPVLSSSGDHTVEKVTESENKKVVLKLFVCWYQSVEGIYVRNEVVRSSYARATIELRADVELRDTIVVAMPKLVGEGFYLCTIRVEYEWKPPSGKKKQDAVPKQEVSNSNPFDALNSIENNDDLGTNGGNSKSVRKGSLNVAHGSSSNIPVIDKINKLEHQILDGKLMFVDDDGNPIVPTGNVDSESEVEVVFSETENLMASTSFKSGSDKCYGTNSLLEQWREIKRDDDYDP